MKIALLHTAESNIAGFEEAGMKIGLSAGTLMHKVRADLLQAAREAGKLTPSIAQETAAALQALTGDADVVMLTCSTLGPSVEQLGSTGVPVLRVDAELAKRSVRNGGLVVALCALDTTIEPTTRLFTQAAESTDATIDVRLIRKSGTFFWPVITSPIARQSPRQRMLHMKREPILWPWLKHQWRAQPAMLPKVQDLSIRQVQGWRQRLPLVAPAFDKLLFRQ
ncbi:hypothetical protein QFZ34_002290 [Phyllobacterium ifriqiyense]|uniref:Asp/Glu racemase n=1 Tax=Phyllobacterium ifriqiyense TaxID=314238 RepID=A0ABU0S8N1_9HYPH|nr:hypothetical protein [Phyllobacterium ifriqiyense]MDQ0997108.1 hypothetical protein [Phyllobacterium ifriqiyense]